MEEKDIFIASMIEKIADRNSKDLKEICEIFEAYRADHGISFPVFIKLLKCAACEFDLIFTVMGSKE